MGYLGEIFVMAMTAIFIQNFVLSRFLGLWPYLGVSKKIDSAFGMGMAVIFVMTLASAITYLINRYLLANFMYLQTIAFILTIAALVQFVEMVIQKNAPALYKSLGVYLPLITTNCAVLATATEAAKPGFFKMNLAITNSAGALSLGEALVYTLGVSVGFGLALVTFAALRERLDLAPVSRLMKGTPIAFITAGLLSLAYVGMSGWFGL
jgi:electron transport complex protein RnfA